MVITDFSSDDLSFAVSQANEGKNIIEGWGNVSGLSAANLLDNAFIALVKSEKYKRYSNEDVANRFGYLFGELLRDNFSFSWKYVEDEYGREPALIEDKSGSIIFPINAVWKRLEPELILEPFFGNIYESLKKHINSLSKTDDK